MLVFVDESGDAGMKLAEGSSAVFVVTAVLFEDHEEAAACDRHIDEIRLQLGLKAHKEFHFAGDTRAIRESFLREVSQHEFFYFSVVLNKAKLWGPGFRYKSPFYKYAVNLVFQNMKPYLSDAIVVIDRSGDRIFRTQLATYLRKRINESKDASKTIKKVRAERSHNNNLVQLADMVCGAVARSFRLGRKDQHLYRQIVRHRELMVQKWPR
jgi:hypothetical protein